ncbi:hypothetical protein VNI00_015010 [Paramarasmius palmivorus]|uniref:Uncharacterized protein n=1 Tax=Paramarasmius palmivorus TaxID=297713 RepID=A0AAW0BNP5_9AGAR
MSSESGALHTKLEAEIPTTTTSGPFALAQHTEHAHSGRMLTVRDWGGWCKKLGRLRNGHYMNDESGMLAKSMLPLFFGLPSQSSTISSGIQRARTVSVSSCRRHVIATKDSAIPVSQAYSFLPSFTFEDLADKGFPRPLPFYVADVISVVVLYRNLSALCHVCHDILPAHYPQAATSPKTPAPGSSILHPTRTPAPTFP